MRQASCQAARVRLPGHKCLVCKEVRRQRDKFWQRGGKILPTHLLHGPRRRILANLIHSGGRPWGRGGCHGERGYSLRQTRRGRCECTLRGWAVKRKHCTV